MPKRQAQRIIDNRSANRNPTTISGITLTSPGTAYTAGDGLTLTGVVLAVGAGDGISVAADAVAVDSTVVRTTRTVTAGSGLTGGGALSSNLTLNVGAGDGISVAADAVAVDSTVVRTTRTVTAGSGLTGGGALSSNLTLNVGAGTLITVGADTVGITPGTAAYQVPLTGGSPYTPSWVGLADIVGVALNFAGGKINVDGSIAGSGLTWTGGSYTYATITQRGTATSAAGAGTAAGYNAITQRGTTTTATGAGTSGGYETITQRGSAQSANSYTNSLSVSAPTGLAEDDVLVAVVTWWAQTLTAPSGWTQIGDTLSWSHPDGTLYARAYYRVAGASEPSSYAWALNANNDIACTIVAYSNVDTSTPIAANGGQTQTSASMTAPTITPATAADMLLFLGAVGDSDAGTRTATPPSGMTELADTTASTWIKSYAAHELLSASGATGTRTATLSASARNAAFLVSLRPSSTAAVNTSVTINAPSGLTTDDVLLATVAYAGGTLTPPSGWTQIVSQAGTGVTLAVYRKIAVSEPSSYTWSLNSTDGLAVALSAYDGVDLADPIGAYGAQANSSSTSMTAPTITPATAADMLYFAGAVAGNVRATVPSGMTEEADAGATGVGVYGADELLASGSATGTRTATLASAAANAAALVSLRAVATEEIDTSVSVSLPTGTTTDDVLIAVVAYVSGTLTPPSGWTQILSQAYTGGTVRVYRRTATGSEPSTYEWALDSSAALAVTVAAYDGVDLTTPIDASASQANTSGTSLTAPTVTTTLDTCLLILAGGVAGNVRASAPSGMAEEADAGTTGVGVYLADESLSADGATGTRTATLASAAANAGALVALRPAATSSGGGGVINVAVSGLGLSVGDDVITLASNSNPGTEASILATDESGYLTLVRLSTSDRVRSPILDTASGNMTVQPANDVMLDPAGGRVRLAANRTLQSDNYASQTTGMRVTYAGEGDFRYLFVDEMHAKSFIADLEQALAGGQIISKSVAVLASAFTAPAAGATATLVVRDLPSAPDMACFVANDIVRLRQFSRAAGSLTIADCWGVVTAYTDNADGTQSWTFTRSSAPNAGAMTAGTVIAADALVLDYGTTGNGYYEVNAIDGAYGLNSPYAQIVSWATHPATGQTVRSRLGNLRGIFGTANEYGLYAGAGTATSDAYLRISNTEVGLYNLPLRMYTGGTERVHIAAHNDVWIGPSSADKRLSWDGSTLTVKGAIVIQAGSSGIGTFTDAGALATANSAAWGTQVSGRPTELTDGRITTAINASGIVQSRVDPGVNWGANPGAGYAGLLLGADYMGYWTGTAWRSYMDNLGRFYLNAGTSSNYLSWNGTTLSIDGTIVVRGGSGIDSFTDAGALATADNLDDVPNGATYSRVNSTIISGGNIRVGSGTKDSTLNGWNIDSTEIVGQTAGVDQVTLNTSGQIVAGAGGVVLDATGVTAIIDGAETNSRSYKFSSGGTVDAGLWAGNIYYEALSLRLSLLANCAANNTTAHTDRDGILTLKSVADGGYTALTEIIAEHRNASKLTSVILRAENTGTSIRLNADSVTIGSSAVWHAGNDGSGSGLDADLLDGNHAAAFALLSGATFTGALLSSSTVGADWSALTPASGWTNHDTANWAVLGVKRFGNLVSLKGLVRATSNQASGSVIYTLASEYRPTRHRMFNMLTSNASRVVRVDVQSSGNIVVQAAINSDEWVTIEITYFTGG